MKKLHLLLLAAVAAVVLTFTPGCSSTPARAAYNAVSIPAVTVDQAMTAWGDYVAQYHPSAAVESQVKDAYDKYQAAELLAIDAAQAYAAVVSSTNSTGAAVAQQLTGQNAAQALADLVALLRQLGVNI
jgi:hypothetical protein